MSSALNEKAAFDALVAKITARCPSFRIRFKEDIWWERLLGWFLRLTRINPNYTTGYITTWGSAVDWPTRTMLESDYDSAFKGLSHEYFHIWRTRVTRGWALVRWASPQALAALALLAVLALLSPWFWLALAFLVALAPWPSPGRSDEEMGGYVMNMAINHWRYGSVLDATIEWIVPQFTGRWYYWMCRDEKKVRARLQAERERLAADTFFPRPDETPYRDVLAIIKG